VLRAGGGGGTELAGQDDWELMRDARRLDGYTEVAFPSTLVTSKIPPELCTEAIVAWDCLVYLSEEVLQEMVPTSWAALEQIFISPGDREGVDAARIHMCLTEAIYRELPQRERAAFKGRPLNRFTWQEHLREYLAMVALELRYTATPNLSEEDAMLGVPHRREESKRVALLVVALGENDYPHIPLPARLAIFTMLTGLALETTAARKHIENTIDDIAKLANRKREDISTRMRELEQEYKHADADMPEADKPAEPAEVQDAGKDVTPVVKSDVTPVVKSEHPDAPASDSAQVQDAAGSTPVKSSKEAAVLPSGRKMVLKTRADLREAER